MAKNGIRLVAALSLSLILAEGAAAIQVTLNLVQPQSTILFRADLGGTLAAPSSPTYAQDDPAFPTVGVTDGDPSRPSNLATFQGTITVDVDNVSAPTTIQILSADMPAGVNGSWLPEVQSNWPGCNIPGGPNRRMFLYTSTGFGGAGELWHQADRLWLRFRLRCRSRHGLQPSDGG